MATAVWELSRLRVQRMSSKMFRSRLALFVLAGFALVLYLNHTLNGRILQFGTSTETTIDVAFGLPQTPGLQTRVAKPRAKHSKNERSRRKLHHVEPTSHRQSHAAAREKWYQPKEEAHPACIKVWSNPYRHERGWRKFYRALETYKTFHRVQRHRLWNDAPTAGGPREASVRTLTWVCNEASLCHGIGDQLAQIQMAFLLAVVTDRVFFIYWNPKQTSGTMHYLQPRSIDWRTHALHTIHSTNSTLSGHISGPKQYSLLFSRLQQSEKHITLSDPFRAPFMAAYRDSLGCGEISEALSSLGLPDILRRGHEDSLPHLLGTILRYLFEFDSEITDRVEQVKTKLGLSYRPYSALHLRTGFLGGKWEEIGIFNKRKIWKDQRQWVGMMNCALNTTDARLGSTAPLYLATDSYIVKEWATELFADRVKFADLTLEHVGLNQTWETHRTLSNTTGNGAAWVDFLLMAHSQLLAHGISGFSGTAGSFCSLPLAQQMCLPTNTH